jgi:hypothetical protein
MKQKKFFVTAVILILALSLIAASLGGPKYTFIKAGKNATVSNGRAGISFTNSYYSGTVKVARMESSNPPGETPISFAESFLDVRFTTSGGDRITHVLGPVYVYFLARRSQIRQWREGGLSIYYFDTWKSEWKECQTVLIDSNLLACRIRIFGLYGLAEK